MNNKDLTSFVYDWLASSNLSSELAMFTGFAIDLVILIIIAFITNWITKSILLRLIKKAALSTKNTFDDALVREKVFSRLSHISPVLVLQFLGPLIFAEFPRVLPLISLFANAYIIAIVMMVIAAFITALKRYLFTFDRYKDQPLESYAQLSKLIVYILGGILILSIVLNKSPLYFFSAFGAASVVIVLVFKDTILGFVASIQLAANDMIRIGDWVEMPKYGADGDVIKITLSTIKVRNFDKTITTVPTYAFISDSFKNWRGMTETGARRIKRAIYINMNSLKYCTPEMLNRYKKFHLVEEYVDRRQHEIEAYNTENKIDKSELINGRHQTNIGMFRQYAVAYLADNPNIEKDNFTLMVRQLAPEKSGVGIEIYCFVNDTAWVNYENIQADIFDHLLTAVNYFDLQLFQHPSGTDFSKIANN